MVTAETVRGWQIDQLRKGVSNLRNVLNTIAPTDAITLRDGGTGWTVLEVLCHLRDYEGLFLERARLTVEQDTPPLPNPNPDQLAAESHYSEQDLEAVYAEWASRRAAFLAYITQIDPAAWARQGDHPVRGLITLQQQLALAAFHDVNHLEQILHIVAAKPA